MPIDRNYKHDVIDFLFERTDSADHYSIDGYNLVSFLRDLFPLILSKIDNPFRALLTSSFSHLLYYIEQKCFLSV